VKRDTMKPVRSFAFCVWPSAACLLLLLCGPGLGCKRADAAANNSRQPTPQQADSAYFKTPFQTESQFVVENIAAEIAEMICFAQEHRLADLGLLFAYRNSGPLFLTR
jgi:hypothetical protein